MTPIKPRFIVDDHQVPQGVVLSMEEWERIVEELEELDDIRLYDEAKKDADESVPFEDAVREIREQRNA